MFEDDLDSVFDPAQLLEPRTVRFRYAGLANDTRRTQTAATAKAYTSCLVIGRW